MDFNGRQTIHRFEYGKLCSALHKSAEACLIDKLSIIKWIYHCSNNERNSRKRIKHYKRNQKRNTIK